MLVDYPVSPLAQPKPSAPVLHFAESLRQTCLTGGLTVVLCDDYLDPRLEEIQAKQDALGQAWLLTKVTGQKIILGPLFTPGAAHSPCWYCLAARMQRNQPAHSVWRHLGAGLSRGLPVRADALAVQTAHAVTPHLIPFAMRVLTMETPSMLVWSTHVLSADAPELPEATVHAVHRRPQCPHCGDPHMLTTQQFEPVRLQPCHKLATAHGGARGVLAQDTVQRLLPWVSEVSGVVNQLVQLNTPQDGQLSVYRSHFYRTQPSDTSLSKQSFVQVCLGKGMTDMQSRASALCEAVERYAAFYQGDEACVHSPAQALDAPYVLPSQLSYVSSAQRMPPVLAYHPCEPADWTPAWSLTHDALRYLPLGACYANAPSPAQRLARWNSNGCAAGNTKEEAILQGLLELIERDAAAIWWYNEIARPCVPVDTLSSAHSQALAQTIGSDWDYWLLDITHDLGIPVVVAIGQHRKLGLWGIGFGCSLSLPQAAERAVTELVQLIAVDKCLPAQWTQGRAQPPSFLYPQEQAKRVPVLAASYQDIAQDIQACVEAAACADLEVILHDYSRPDIPLHTVKVVVPGLCHVWPELANPRLYQVPVKLGWLPQSLTEAQFNTWALYL
nr:TOMM precursor leader peptide-binding protein [Curvibacter sp. CHRR-16]